MVLNRHLLSDHRFSTHVKFCEKLNFSQNFAYVLNGWFVIGLSISDIEQAKKYGGAFFGGGGGDNKTCLKSTI